MHSLEIVTFKLHLIFRVFFVLFLLLFCIVFIILVSWQFCFQCFNVVAWLLEMELSWNNKFLSSIWKAQFYLFQASKISLVLAKEWPMYIKQTSILVTWRFCLNFSRLDYIIEKEPLVNKFISVPSDGGKVSDTFTVISNYSNNLINFTTALISSGYIVIYICY